MAKNEGGKPANAAINEVCPVHECKKPIKKMHFCQDHFVWYKEGLINKRGERPSDFDKKYQQFLRKKAA